MTSRTLVRLLLPALLLGGAAPAADVPPEKGSRQALLIGVTAYPKLEKSLWLDGGANDVLLMKRLLTEKFGFAADDIVILSEAEGAKDAKKLPTRANIQRFLGLASKALRHSQKNRRLPFISGCKSTSIKMDKQGSLICRLSKRHSK